MSFQQQSLVDALLLSASAASAAASSTSTSKKDATAPPTAARYIYGGAKRASGCADCNDDGVSDPCYDSMRRILPRKPSRRPGSSSSSSSSLPMSMGPLAPRLIVDLSFLASSSSSSSSSPKKPKKPSSSRQHTSKPIDDDDAEDHNEDDRGRRSAKRREERRSRSRVRPRVLGGGDNGDGNNSATTIPRSNVPGARRAHPAAATHEEPADSSTSSSSSSSRGSTTSTSTAATAELSASTTTDDDSATTTCDPPGGPCRHRSRCRRRTRVRFALDANDGIVEEAFECPYDSPLTDEERALCYVTRRETQRDKRAAVVFAREHAVRHVHHVHLLERLLATPLKCAAGGGRGGDGTPTRESEEGRLVESADAALRWVHPKAVSSGGDDAATLDDKEYDAMTRNVLQRIGDSEVRGLEPFVAPLLRKHQRWAIRTVLERHRQLTKMMTTQKAGGRGHGSSSAATQCRRRDGDGDDDDDEALLRLRRCCELVNACTRDLARLLAEADAREAQKIYR
jgi:hypothetical protein